MGEVIYLSRQQAADATVFRELIKFYKGKNNPRYEEAIERNKERYKFVLDEVLATKEVSEENIAA